MQVVAYHGGDLALSIQSDVTISFLPLSYADSVPSQLALFKLNENIGHRRAIWRIWADTGTNFRKPPLTLRMQKWLALYSYLLRGCIY